MRVLSGVVRSGLAAAWRRPLLVAALWLLNLFVALAFGLPGWLALHGALAPLPEADVLAQGVSLSLLADLAELHPGLLPGLFLAGLGAALFGLLGGAALTGGVLEVLTSADQRPLGHRLGRGAGRYFWRFVRAGLMTAVPAVLLAALVGGPLMALSGRLRSESDAEVAARLLAAAAPLAAGLVVLVFLLALDAARVRIVRDDERRVFAALRAGLGLVLRHPALWLGAWAANLALFLVVLGAYLAASGSLRAPGVAGLLGLVALQQAFVLARSWLRVALLGSELALVERLQPRPPAAAPAPPPAPPPPAEPEPAAPEPAGSGLEPPAE